MRHLETLDFKSNFYYCREWLLFLGTETTEKWNILYYAKKRTRAQDGHTPTSVQRFTTVKQVADRLGLSTKTIYEAIEAGKLQAKKTGKQFLITREAVREYLESLPSGKKRKVNS